jgi:hypothetical protein
MITDSVVSQWAGVLVFFISFISFLAGIGIDPQRLKPSVGKRPSDERDQDPDDDSWMLVSFLAHPLVQDRPASSQVKW